MGGKEPCLLETGSTLSHFLLILIIGELNMTNKELRVPVEVYSRVVGYFRPVKRWNNRKKEEFSQRKVYKTDTLFNSPVYEYQRNS